MSAIHSVITGNIDWLVIGMLLVEVIALMLFLFAARRQNQLYRTYKKLIQGSGTMNLEEVLYTYADQVQGMEERIKNIQNTINRLSNDIKHKVDPAKMIRYNAFAESGNDLSFSMALLNENQDGVVITSLYGREDSRVYAKPVQNGESTYKLSEEEQIAISKVSEAKILKK